MYAGFVMASDFFIHYVFNMERENFTGKNKHIPEVVDHLNVEGQKDKSSKINYI